MTVLFTAVPVAPKTSIGNNIRFVVVSTLPVEIVATAMSKGASRWGPRAACRIRESQPAPDCALPAKSFTVRRTRSPICFNRETAGSTRSDEVILAICTMLGSCRLARRLFVLITCSAAALGRPDRTSRRCFGRATRVLPNFMQMSLIILKANFPIALPMPGEDLAGALRSVQ